MIALMGSVFSTYYAWSGRADPINHCALNVALYGRGGRRWAMTERGRGSLFASQRDLVIGPSSVRCEGDSIVIDIDETCAPLPRRVQGRIVIHPQIETPISRPLDPAGRHLWWPIAPLARVEVEMRRPGVSWSGNGYVDANAGEVPLEADFSRWNWSYARRKKRAAVFYDVEFRDGTSSPIGLDVSPSGDVREIDALVAAPLGRTSIWRMARSTRADTPGEAMVLRTLEDTPFYSRSTVAARLFGETTVGMHESLCLNRLSQPVVRALLPFRNPRALKTQPPRGQLQP